MSVQQLYAHFLLICRLDPSFAYALRIHRMNTDYYKNGEDLRYTPTTLEQEKDLFLKAAAGDAEARDFLIRNHMLFVANRARALTRGKIPDDEVISAANEALIKAIDSFDPTPGVRFTCYLKSFIKGAVAKLWKQTPKTTPVEADGSPIVCSSSEESMSPAEEMEAKETKQILSAALKKFRGKLSLKQRELLVAVYDNGLSLSDFAKSRGVHRSVMCRLHKRALQNLRAAMRGVEL